MNKLSSHSKCLPCVHEKVMFFLKMCPPLVLPKSKILLLSIKLENFLLIFYFTLNLSKTDYISNQPDYAEISSKINIAPVNQGRIPFTLFMERSSMLDVIT